MSFVLKLTTYFKEAFAEMKKVVWPTKKQTTTYTVVVLAMSIGLAAFFTGLDNVFNQIIDLLIG